MSRPNFKFLTLTDAEISSQKRIPLKCTKIGYFWTKIGPNGQNFEKRKENFRNTQKTNVHGKFQVSNHYRCWDITADRHTLERTDELMQDDWIVALLVQLLTTFLPTSLPPGILWLITLEGSLDITFLQGGPAGPWAVLR